MAASSSKREAKAREFRSAARRLEQAAEDYARELGGPDGSRFLARAAEVIQRLPDPEERAALRRSVRPATPPLEVPFERYEDTVIASLLDEPLLWRHRRG